jgi:hypothetical protein
MLINSINSLYSVNLRANKNWELHTPNCKLNMGVASGPGYPFQVLAFPTRNPNPRSGLSTTIPNAASAQGQIFYH